MEEIRIYCFQHVSYEGLGCIEDWALNEGHSIFYTKFFEGDELPNINDLDWLIVMGGPMSVHDEKDFPWLKDEKEFIDKALVMESETISKLDMIRFNLSNRISNEKLRYSH